LVIEVKFVAALERSTFELKTSQEEYLKEID
jgi:hypothetical protein